MIHDVDFLTLCESANNVFSRSQLVKLSLNLDPLDKRDRNDH